MSELKLTKRQDEALKYMLRGDNILLTGPAGTGKTLVISQFKKLSGVNKTIAVTSMTGISAILLGGVTMHSYLGIGLGRGTAEELADAIKSNPRSKRKWTDLDVLIIDEVSMLSPELFDKLEKVAGIVRKRNRLLANAPSIKEKPFGGIQLILCGDFLQLPVVNGNDSFCFEAEKWKECIQRVVYLNEIVRQPDPEFQNVLNDLRYGIVSEEARSLLDSCIGVELKNEFGVKPTRIYTTNRDVDGMNERELDKLAEANPPFYQYDMEVYFYDFVTDRNSAMEKYRKNCIAPERIQLCVGAQVMLLCNLDVESGLANGSRGVVTGFIEGVPEVCFANGQTRLIDYNTWEIFEGKKKIVKITQVPLKLAWCITVHKSQSVTLDLAEVDLTNIFEYGQGYVALSRVKTKDGLKIIGINYEAIRAHPKAVRFYRELEEVYQQTI